MRKRTTGVTFDNVRMLSVSEAERYVGLGRNAARKFAEDAGAVRKYGRRVLIDKAALDLALNQMAAAE